MSPVTALATLVVLVVVSTAVGLAWRASAGRVRAPRRARAISAAQLGYALGSRATLVQFSSEFCASCGPTSRRLARLAAERPGVVHTDLDVATASALARRWNVLQTPTVFVLDALGVPVGRIGGAPRLAELEAALARLDAAAPRVSPLRSKETRVAAA